MIGLYFIAVILTWLCLSIWVVVRLGRWRGTSNDENKAKRRVVSALVLLAWFGASFWYSGGRNCYSDWKVRQLCAVDGGVKVYETVTLPPERFDNYGNVRIYDKKYANPKDEYYLESDQHYLQKGNPDQTGNPDVLQTIYRIIRRSDGKAMGEAVSYIRRGGGLPGPWHPSSFRCPEQLNFESSILKNQEKNP